MSQPNQSNLRNSGNSGGNSGNSGHENSGVPTSDKEVNILRKNLQINNENSGAESKQGSLNSSTGSQKSKVNQYCSALTWAQRPNFNTTGRDIKLVSNFFEVIIPASNQNITFFKYSVMISPEIPNDSNRLRRRIVYQAKDEISKSLSNFFFLNTMIFSQTFVKQCKANAEIDSTAYTIDLKWVGEASIDSREVFPIFKKFFFGSLDKKRYNMFKRSYFADHISLKNSGYDLEVWQGFNPTVNSVNGKILINLELICKLVRGKTAHQELKEIFMNCKGAKNPQKEAKKAFTGVSVLTRYNNDKLYLITDVDFSQNPQSTFDCKGSQITYASYYKTKYSIQIQDLNQPLLVNFDKKTGKTCYLIPEICFMTGMTDQMRADFKLMKEISRYTIGQASEKTRDTIKIMNDIINSTTYQKQSQNSGFTISRSPVEFNGKKLSPGSFLLGKNQSFDIDGTPDIDRKIQTTMFSSPKLTNWGIAYPSFLARSVNGSFIREFQNVVRTFQLECSPPTMMEVRSNHFQPQDMIRVIGEQHQRSPLKFCVCILPGKKSKKGVGYKEVKAYCTSQLGIPTQMILEGTIGREKGLRSVLNKVLIQDAAKIGGTPWAINKLPLMEIPTAIVSFSPAKGILSSVCSINSALTQYNIKVSNYSQTSIKDEMVNHLEIHLNNFASRFRGIYPRLIIYRENETKNGGILQFKEEVERINDFLKENKKYEKVNFTYILTNKKHKLKIATINGSGSNYQNVPSGTLVDSTIIGNDYDFYLVSQKTNQGLAQATYYKVIFDGNKTNSDDLHLLTYKLCFLYYNWVGAIKTPAAQHYAKRLTSLMTDVMCTNAENSCYSGSVENGNYLMPNDNLQSLFFI